MVDNPLFKSIEEEYFQGEKIYNYGGFIPEIIFQPTSTPNPTPSITPTITPTATPAPSPTPLPIQAEYTAILNRASALGFSPPCALEQTKQNQLIFDLKNVGLFAKIGTFYMFKVDTTCASSSFTLINWKVPSNAICQLEVFLGGILPIHNSDEGWRFNQTNRLRLGNNLNGGNPVLSVTSTGNTIGVYYYSFLGNSTSGLNNMWQTNNNSWNFARHNNTTAHSVLRNNALTTTYDFTGNGYKSVSIDGQPNADTTIIFNNNGVLTTRTKTAVDSAIAGGALFINGSTASEAHSWVCGMFFYGTNGFTSSESVVFETIMTAYMTS